MKKIALTIAAVLFGIAITFAGNIGDNPPKPNKALQTTVKQAIDYPSYMTENDIKGTVYISMIVNQTGQATVSQCFSLNKDLQKTAKEQLETKDMSNLSPGKYDFKLTFELY